MVHEYLRTSRKYLLHLIHWKKEQKNFHCRNREKHQLSSILLQYDSKMIEKQEEIENLQKIIEDEKCKLEFYKVSNL